MTGFGQRLTQAFSDFGHLCVGVDPHPYLLDLWECPDTAIGLREFSLRVIDASAESVGIIKPQVAFYERHGAEGISVLEYVIGRAQDAGLLVISDCKRGDIGSTMDAYAQAWLTPEWTLSSDAITVSPYLGVGALENSIDYALKHNRGVFVLAATSNPEAAITQSAVVQQGPDTGKTVAASNLGTISQWSTTKNPQHSIGAVLGATVDFPALGIDIDDYSTFPVLAPGFGFQGAQVEQAHDTFGHFTKLLIVSETRSVLDSGRDKASEVISRRAQKVAEFIG